MINNQLRRKTFVQATKSRNEPAELTLKSSKNWSSQKNNKNQDEKSHLLKNKSNSIKNFK